jgi:FkbM family methyltransferase
MHPLIRFAAKFAPQTWKQSVKDDLQRYFQAPSMEFSLRNMRNLGFHPKIIVDVGAHIGQWSLMAHGIFPDASFLMLEAQTSKSPTLEAVSRAHPGKFRHRIALLGPEPRDDVVFHECEAAPTASSVLSCHEPLAFQDVKRRMETLDGVLAEAGVPQTDLLKLDVQGYELEVLKGAVKTLTAAPAVLIEVSTVELYQGSPLFHEVVAFMEAHGYRVYDVCSLMRLHSNDTLVQLDLLFLRANSPLFAQAIGQL